MKHCNPKTSPVLTFTTIILAIALAGCNIAGAGKTAQRRSVTGPKYTILLIGDGMGPVQIDMARKYASSVSGKPVKLAMDELPYRCRSTTFSASSSVTDSAASGTALACGVKTNNGMLGQTPDGQRLTSVAEMAKKAGLKVGLITSVPTNHATPAAFYAHVESRNEYNKIAEQFIESDFDLLAGGGISYKGGTEAKQAHYARLNAAGYAIAAGRDEVAALSQGDKAVITFDEKRTSFPMTIEAKPGELTLPEVTAKAIEVLDGPEGFFIMVEGGMIDWTGHDNDLAANIHETLSFDKAVAVALEFYRQHPEETLVVFTADHETGGMTIAEDTEGLAPMSSLANQSQEYGTMRWHINHLPEEDRNKWEAVKPILIDSMGLQDASRKELTEIQKAWMDSTLPAEQQKALGWSRYHPAVETALKIKARRCGVSWSTHGHTATPVVTAAIGFGAEAFTQATDNALIAATLMANYGCKPTATKPAAQAVEPAAKAEVMMAK